MKVIDRLWNDIKRGENIDLYFSLIVAVVLSVTSLVGIIPQSAIMPTILVALTLLAISNLVGRQRIEQVIEKSDSIYEEVSKSSSLITAIGNERVPAKRFFLTRSDRPPMETRLKNAKTVDFLGSTLISLSTSSDIRILRKSGAKVRLIVSNPKNIEQQKFLAQIHLEIETAKNLKQYVESSLAQFRILQGVDPSGGSVEVKVTDFPIPFSYMGVDTESPMGNIQIELYLTKAPVSQYPMFLLHSNVDTGWYETFKQQFDFYWENATKL